MLLFRVWNHPFILLKAKEKADIARVLQEDAEEDEQFINDDDEESEAKSTGSDNSEESGSDVEEVKRRKITTRGGRGDSDKLVAGLDEVKAETLASDKGWWSRFMQDPEDDHELMNLELGSKMVLLMDILKECYLIGDKVLVFSQSLMSLDLIEKFLQLADSGDLEEMFGTWKHGKDYFRMDGSTAPDVRKKWCSYFNNKKNTDMRLFLISTKAGGLGINLVAANRVIIFDASWNPAHDVQSIFRVYRFGQEKPVYIYRFLAKGTMEEKIYDRQVTKQSLSARVVDEQQIERHFTMNELAELYTFNDEPKENQPTFKLPQDKLLAELITKHKDLIWKIHDHDSLLENQVDEQLTEEERKAAWKEFEDEKEGIRNIASTSNLNMGVVMSQINPEMIRVIFGLLSLQRRPLIVFHIILESIPTTIPAFNGGSNQPGDPSLHDTNPKRVHWKNRLRPVSLCSGEFAAGNLQRNWLQRLLSINLSSEFHLLSNNHRSFLSYYAR